MGRLRWCRTQAVCATRKPAFACYRSGPKDGMTYFLCGIWRRGWGYSGHPALRPFGAATSVAFKFAPGKFVEPGVGSHPPSIAACTKSRGKA